MYRPERAEERKMKFLPYSFGLKLYERMPPRMKYVTGVMMRPIPRRILRGQGFQEKLELLTTSDKWQRDKLEQFQSRRLRVLLDHANRNVPYYHELFKKTRFHPGDLTPSGSLKMIPFLTKDIVRGEYQRLLAANSIEYQPGEASTTGSTGPPLHFQLDQQNREMEYASVWRHYHWARINDLNARIASFRGDFVSEHDSGTLWRWDARLGELTFNTYDLSQENIGKMIARLNRFKPHVIRGYPHSLYIICKGMERVGSTLSFTPRCVQTSSEQLLVFMRESIESTFGSKVLDWYGQSEYVISAGECLEGQYHQNMETGILNIEEDPWGMEKLIGTGLWNFSMPFINYEIGDCCLVDDGDCNCGRKHQVLKSIEGRLSDIIVTSTRQAFSGAGIDNFYEKEIIPHLQEIPDFFKLVQVDIKTFTIEVFRQGGLIDKDVVRIRNAFIGLLGKDVDITVELLDGFPKQIKWKNVESRLSPEAVAKLLEERS
jgi:phenylacetate-CoA ligase